MKKKYKKYLVMMIINAIIFTISYRIIEENFITLSWFEDMIFIFFIIESLILGALLNSKLIFDKHIVCLNQIISIICSFLILIIFILLRNYENNLYENKIFAEFLLCISSFFLGATSIPKFIYDEKQNCKNDKKS